MHIALSLNKNTDRIGAVAFDFDGVLEPHEHLQRDMLVYASGADITDAPRLWDWIHRNIGKRAFVWARERSHINWLGAWIELETKLQRPWAPHQIGDLQTLAWAAQHVLGSEFHVPSIALAGLDPEVPLQAAAVDATLIQAALRALILHERRHGPGKSTYPKES